MNVHKNSLLSLMFIALSMLGQTAAASPPDAKDDGTNWCDGLDPSSGIYSTCIQAHSAKNRVEHLQSKNASASSISKAQASLDEAVAQYGELGGAVLPGIEPVSTCPCNGLSVGNMIWDSSVIPDTSTIGTQQVFITTVSGGYLTAVTKTTGVAYCTLGSGAIGDSLFIPELTAGEGTACRDELISFIGQ